MTRNKKPEQTDLVEYIDKETGEITPEKLNTIIYKKSVRKNGTKRIQLDFSCCPTMTEQHTAHLSDINYLISKYRPDELAAYIAARNSHRQEIVGHDFTNEPDLQEGLNIVADSKRNFNDLPEEIRNQFPNHLEFIKFVDNPANEQKLIDMKLLTKKQIQSIKIPEPNGKVEATKSADAGQA